MGHLRRCSLQWAVVMHMVLVQPRVNRCLCRYILAFIQQRLRREEQGVTNAEAQRLRDALEQILAIGSSPDTNVISVGPDGEPGPVWSTLGAESAVARMTQIARAALS